MAILFSLCYYVKIVVKLVKEFYMNVLNIEHVSKIFGEKRIFDDVSYGIHEGDKIGIIGINGTGKTTLLKIIAGIEEPDEGQIIKQNGLRITYLPQNPEFPADATVLSYVSDGKDYEAQNILNKLGTLKFITISPYGIDYALLHTESKKIIYPF